MVRGVAAAPGRLRAPAAAAFVVLGSVTLLAIPVLGRFGARPDNPTLLDRHYVAGWAAGRRTNLAGDGGRDPGPDPPHDPPDGEGVTVARVLVVDDDHTVREVVVSYLRAHQHDVVDVGDGEAALRAMRETRPTWSCST